MNNQRIRFIFDDMPVRGVHVQLKEVWQHIVSRKHYPQAIRRALGELLAAGALLSSNLKLDGTLTLQVQGQGVLKMLVVEATSDNTLRAVARWDESANLSDDDDLIHLLGKNGIFAITLQPKDGEQWQGIVPLKGENIAEMLMNYMMQSEQLDTHIALVANDECVAGLLLQKLPETPSDEDSWTHLSTLAQTLQTEELAQLDAQHLLYRLYHETPPRLFPEESLEFACTCSRGKVSDMLLMLGREEVNKAIAQEGCLTIHCDFCNEEYAFDETDIQVLFGVEWMNVSPEKHYPLQ